MLPSWLRHRSRISGRLWLRSSVSTCRARRRDAHVALGHLLAQRLAERADGELARVVDARTGARGAPGDRADVDEVGDPARSSSAASQQMRQRRVRQYISAAHVEVEHPLPLGDVGARRSVPAASRPRC